MKCTIKNPELPRDHKGQLIKFTSVGCYPVFYLTKQGNVLCGDCAYRNELHPTDSDPNVDADVNYEDASLYCDECGERIESAYLEDENETAMEASCNH